MVRAVLCYQKTGNSNKYSGLGRFLLPKVRKLKQIEWFGLFSVIKSQESQPNVMVWAGFFLSKVRKIQTNRMVSFFFLIPKAGKVKEIEWLRFCCYQKSGNKYNGLGWFFVIRSQETRANRIV